MHACSSDSSQKLLLQKLRGIGQSWALQDVDEFHAGGRTRRVRDQSCGFSQRLRIRVMPGYAPKSDP